MEFDGAPKCCSLGTTCNISLLAYFSALSSRREERRGEERRGEK
jgi:hypothetical protein